MKVILTVEFPDEVMKAQKVDINDVIEEFGKLKKELKAETPPGVIFTLTINP